jgi:CRISPR/Cas system CMR-associated protein Cmr1 (group 7 of RAMP superfamily)
MTWTTLTLQVTTPLFNGGADPDGSAGFRPEREAGVRVASIRGAMRFWSAPWQAR